MERSSQSCNCDTLRRSFSQVHSASVQPFAVIHRILSQHGRKAPRTIVNISFNSDDMRFTTFILAAASTIPLTFGAAVKAPTYSRATTSPAAVAVRAQKGAQCTTTITVQQQFGCSVTAAGATATSTIQCGGCAIKTTTVANPFFGHGPVCSVGRTTTTDATVTATKYVCG